VPVAILKDEASNAKRTSGRQQAGEDANRGNEQGPQSNDEQEESKQQHETNYDGVLDDSAVWRS
jgi:hypothetical protein